MAQAKTRMSTMAEVILDEPALSDLDLSPITVPRNSHFGQEGVKVALALSKKSVDFFKHPRAVAATNRRINA